MPLDPRLDPTFLTLKGIATLGGDRGPLYDLGVMRVIREIEANGSFARDPFRGLLLLGQTQAQLGHSLLTAEEHERASRFLAERRWTWDQGMEYALGVETAEKALSSYDRTELERV